MAPIIEEIRQPGDSPADSFRHGWRYRQSFDADGALVIEQLPLTVEDLLHPQDGDRVTHLAEHQRHRRYLCDIFEAQLRHDPTAAVLDGVRVAWDVPDLGAHGPDIAVILGVRERKNWSTFDVAQEGVHPALLIEITSPETASIDRSVKLEEYEVAGVPLYVIIDGVSRRRDTTLRILAYELMPVGYRPIATNGHGRIWLAPVRSWLGITDGELACFDETGQRLGNFVAQLDRAEAAEQRVRELEAELQRLRDALS